MEDEYMEDEYIETINDDDGLTAEKQLAQKVFAEKQIAIPEKQMLTNLLNEYQLIEHIVLADGNCQFRAIAYQLYGDENKYEFIREMICKHMCEQPTNYNQFLYDESWSSYSTRIKRNKEWGDNITLQACANIFGKYILVISHNQRVLIEPYVKSVLEYNNPIKLSFHNCHYNAIE
jgi:hypothetical protein